MVFSSPIFLFFFLPFALLCYYASPRPLKLLTLTLLSYLFYAWSDPRFTLLLLWVTLVDFTLARLLASFPSPLPHSLLPQSPIPQSAIRNPQFLRRLLLILSLANSLSLLLFFKYGVFAQSLYHSLTARSEAPFHPFLAIVLPAGISFYTFESMSYVVDVYRGVTPAARRPLPFACYLAQFPHLVAGPIIRYQELADQLSHPRITLPNLTRGLFLLSIGLSKKILLADTLSHAVDAAYAVPMLSPHDLWYATFAYSFQLYFDFSGYTDMAIGLALMLGFIFPQNFNAPYRATSITDFWRRWHMTLSRWLRDYLYIPLGGNRKGATRTYFNLLLTMLLGGLWHGASLTFAAWGLYHGALLALERRFTHKNSTGPAAQPATNNTPHAPLKILLTFTLVTIGWIPFRSEDLTLSLYRLSHLVYPTDVPTPDLTRNALYSPQCLTAFLAAALITFTCPTTWTLSTRLTPLKLAYALLLFCASILVLSLTPTGPFLYFRF